MTDTRQDTQKAAGELQGVPDGERSNGTAARRSGGTDGHAPGERRRDQGEAQAAGRGAGRDQTEVKKEIYKYLRERREKKRR